MRTFLILAFWYWFYNQLFFLLAAMGFFIIHFLVAVIGFGGMDTLASGSNIIPATHSCFAPHCCR